MGNVEKRKVVLFIGNGFTIGLAQYLGIATEHNTISLFPPPEWVQDWYAQNTASGLALWHPKRYPQLWAAWEEVVKNGETDGASLFHALCSRLSNETAFQIGPDPTDGPLVVFNSMDAGYQLRRYLWHLFLVYGSLMWSRVLDKPNDGTTAEELMRCLGRSTAEWPMMSFLSFLSTHFDLTIVSFNYDPYVEMLLSANLPEFNHDLRKAMDGESPEPLQLIHPHGSISSFYPKLRERDIPLPDDIFGMEAVFLMTHHIVDFFPVINQYPPPHTCPDFPDLVPPGHNETHLLARFRRFPEELNKLVRSAEVVGCIGFSAAPPDDVEFNRYFSGARVACSFSIGRRNSGRLTKSQEILNAATITGEYRFFDASELMDCVYWLGTQKQVAVNESTAARAT